MSLPHFIFALVLTKKQTKMETYGMIVHGLSALMLIMIGSLRLSNPIKNYEKNSGITLPNQVDLLNELRGTSGVMLLSGITIALGLFMENLNLTAYLVALIVFVGFLIGRVLSIAADGKPNKQISQGIWFEVVFGILNIVGLVSLF